MCQRAIQPANVSTWCTKVPKDGPIFQTFLVRNAKGSFYALVIYKKFYIILDIIVIPIIWVCITHKNCIIFPFYAWCHVKKCVDFYYFYYYYYYYYYFVFCSWVRNENVKRPSFYTLQVARVFSNFPQLNQISQIKNMSECFDLLELWSAWVGHRR